MISQFRTGLHRLSKGNCVAYQVLREESTDVLEQRPIGVEHFDPVKVAVLVVLDLKTGTGNESFILWDKNVKFSFSFRESQKIIQYVLWWIKTYHMPCNIQSEAFLLSG